jgi:hypothetical protein
MEFRLGIAAVLATPVCGFKDGQTKLLPTGISESFGIRFHEIKKPNPTKL